MAKKKEKTETTVEAAPRGQAKSGRFWKKPKEQFRKIHNSLPKKTKDQHLKMREEMKRIKQLSKSIKEEKKQVNKHFSLLEL